jgi:heat shock protein 5
VKSAIEEALEWLEENSDAETDEYEDKLKEVEDKCSPIVSKAYQAGGGDDDEDNDDEDDRDEL